MALVRQNGQLVNVSDEEAKKLREQAGLPAPTTPADTASEGATPDQAKMAGTPAQTQAAQQVALTGTKTLAGTERLDQGRTQASDTEKAAMEKANRLAQIGSLGSRVESLIAQQMNKGAQAVAGGAALDKAQLAGLKLPPDKQKQAEELLTKVAGGDRSTATIEALRQLGVTAPDALIKTSSQAVGQQLAGAVLNSDQVTVDMLGMSTEELTALLGPDWKGKTLEQLQTDVAALQQQDFNRGAEIRTKLADPFTSPAEKERLRRELVGLGQVGMGAAEELVGSLADDVESASEEIKTALADEAISAEIMEYLDDPENSDLAETNPTLAAWADSQREALQAIAEEVKASVDKNKLIFEANTKLAETLGVENDTLIKTLGLDKGGAKVKFPILGVIQGRDNAPEIYGQLNELAEIDPDLAKEFIGMKPKDFERLLVNGQFNEYVKAKRQLRDIKKVNGMNLDQLADFVFGADVDIREVQSSYQKDLELARQGDTVAAKRAARLASIFDQNKDGRLDDPTLVRKQVRSAFRKPTVGAPGETAKAYNFGVGEVGAGSAMEQVFNAIQVPAGGSPGGLLSNLNKMSFSATAGGVPTVVLQQQAKANAAYTPQQIKEAATAQLPISINNLKSIKSAYGQLEQLLKTNLPDSQKKVIQQQMANMKKGLDTASQFYNTQKALYAKMAQPRDWSKYAESVQPTTPNGVPWKDMNPTQRTVALKKLIADHEFYTKELGKHLALFEGLV